MDEAHFELTPHLNSMKDRVIEAVAGDAGDASINALQYRKDLLIPGYLHIRWEVLGSCPPAL